MRALGVVGLAAAVGFALLARHVVTGAADPFDIALTDRIVVRIGPGVRAFLLAFTRLGQADVMTVVATVAGIAIWRRRRAAVGLWAAAALGGFLLTQGLKTLIGRMRPQYAEAFLPKDDSFPSGHVSMTVVFLGLGLYLYFQRERSWAQQTAAIGLAAVYAMLMGLSRLLLGNHYLSDVLGGYLTGLSWLALCVAWAELRRGRRRRGAERVDRLGT